MLGALLADGADGAVAADGAWAERVAQWADVASLALDVVRAGRGGA